MLLSVIIPCEIGEGTIHTVVWK